SLDEPAVAESAGERAVLVAEAEPARGRLHPVAGRDGRTDDLTGAVGDLQRGVVLVRVEAHRREVGVDRLHAHAVPSLYRRPLEHQALRLHGDQLLTAVRVFPVDQTVAVVVDAVAADLDRLGGRRRAIGDHGVAAAAGVAAVGRAHVAVVAVRRGGARLAAGDRLVGAAAGAVAAVHGAGVAVVAGLVAVDLAVTVVVDPVARLVDVPVDRQRRAVGHRGGVRRRRGDRPREVVVLAGGLRGE